MMPLVVTKVYETCVNWDQKSDHQGVLSSFSLRQFANKGKLDRITSKQLEKKESDRNLFGVKNNAAKTISTLKPRPVVGLNCESCTPKSRSEFFSFFKQNGNLNSKTKNTYPMFKDLLNVEEAFYNNSTNFFKKRFLHIIQMLKLKRYNFIEVSDRVLIENKLKEAVDLATQKDTESFLGDSQKYQELWEKNWNRAKEVLFNMRSTMSDIILRLTSWLLYKLLPCFLSKIIYQPAQINMLKKAADTGLPLIFMPLHRSHLDYTIVTYILMNNDIRGPLVAAGDNLNIPILGSALRSLGAFFIKRRIDPVLGQKDIIYRAVLHTYMLEALKAGHYFEFFIEGGRTRTGKPCMPKGGILSVFVDAYFEGVIEDALLIPVSMNYERIVDGNFISEQLGQSKKKESFGTAMKAIWEVLNSNYGMMRIDFNQPFHLKELIDKFQNSNQQNSPNLDLRLTNGFTRTNSNNLLNNHHRPLAPRTSNTSLFGTDVADDKQRKLIENIGKHVVYDCAKSSAIMSTNAVSFLLLNRFRNGVTINELSKALDQFRNDLETINQDVGFTGDSINVINHAIDVLGPNLVKKVFIEENNNLNPIISPVIDLPNVIELSYYSNILVALYSLDSIMANAICSLVLTSNNQEQNQCDKIQQQTIDRVNCKISQNQLKKRVLELCEIFRYEFVSIKPCLNYDYVINQKIQQFQENGLLTFEEKILTDQEKQATKIAKHFESSTDEDEEDETDDSIFSGDEQLNLSSTYRGNLFSSSSSVTDLLSETKIIVEFENKNSYDNLLFLTGLIQPFIESYSVGIDSLSKYFLPNQINGNLPSPLVCIEENELIQLIMNELKEQIKSGAISYSESLSIDSVKNCIRLLVHLNVIESHIRDNKKKFNLTNNYNNKLHLQILQDKFNNLRIKRIN